MKCILYLPYRLEAQGWGARMLRPRKMAEAFRENGYEVMMISGVSSERRIMIREVRKRIRDGEKFDFLYAESNTEPTLLTYPGHLPTHPFLDYGFFRFVKGHGIPLGLFYSDLFWKYEGYGAGLPAWKRTAALACYRYDLRQYEKLLDRFFVPDKETFSRVLGSPRLAEICRELPPGADHPDLSARRAPGDPNRPLTIFYVGGLGGNYQIEELLRAVGTVEGTRLILCCRQAEWEKEKDKLEPLLCDRIRVVHKSSGELEPLYAEADLGSLMFRRGSYMDMAKPFKTYEYLAHELPVLATEGTAAGRFTEENGTGWAVAYNAETLAETLREILRNPAQIAEKRRHCAEAKTRNLWTCRAETAAEELKAAR